MNLTPLARELATSASTLALACRTASLPPSPKSAFTPYFTTKAAGSATGLALAQVQRFAEGRGGAVGIESERGAGTLVRLFLPRVRVGGVPSSLAATEIAYTPSPSGVFHVVNPATAARTS